MLWLGKRKPHWILFQLLTLRLKPQFEQYCALQYLPEEVPSVLRLINRAGQAGCLPGKPSESGQQLAQRNTLKKTSDWARTNKAEMRRDGSGIHSSHQSESHGQVAQAIFKTSDWKVRLSSKKELCGCSSPKKRINLSAAEGGAPVRPFWSAPISNAVHVKWVREAAPTSREASSPELILQYVCCPTDWRNHEHFPAKY